MISTPTDSWIRSRRRRDRIQMPVGVKIISNCSKFSCRQGRNCPHSRWDRVKLNLMQKTASSIAFRLSSSSAWSTTSRFRTATTPTRCGRIYLAGVWHYRQWFAFQFISSTGCWRPRGRRFVRYLPLWLYSVPSRVWTLSSPLSFNFCRLRDDFDDDGQLDSTAPSAPSARSNPTARRRRNHLEVCKRCMTRVTRVSALSMGHSVHYIMFSLS